MRKLLILALPLLVATSVYAQVYKCVGADGKFQFSDIPCKGGQVVPDRGSAVSEQEQQEARQRTAKMQEEVAAKENARAAQDQAEREAETIRNEPDLDEAKRAEAVSNCMRDVERRGASQNTKAELISACQSAGASQRASGASADSVRECVRHVERTGASESIKARQVAICHGADVPPEPYPYKRRSY